MKSISITKPKEKTELEMNCKYCKCYLFIIKVSNKMTCPLCGCSNSIPKMRVNLLI